MRIMLTGIHAFDERLMAAMTNAERIEILNQCASYLKDSPGHELKLKKVNRYIADISCTDIPNSLVNHDIANSSGNDYVSSDSLNRYIADASGSEYISSASLAALQQAVKLCPVCRASVAPTAIKCGRCGRSLKEKAGFVAWVKHLIARTRRPGSPPGRSID